MFVILQFAITAFARASLAEKLHMIKVALICHKSSQTATVIYYSAALCIVICCI